MSSNWLCTEKKVNILKETEVLCSRIIIIVDTRQYVESS